MLQIIALSVFAVVGFVVLVLAIDMFGRNNDFWQ